MAGLPRSGLAVNVLCLSFAIGKHVCTFIMWQVRESD